jgi:glutamine cyclotransferase
MAAGREAIFVLHAWRQVATLKQAALLFVVIGIAVMPTRDIARCGPQGECRQGAVPWYGYELIRAFPHDKEAFTQGLIYRDGFLYEGTGLYGASSLRKVRLETGEVLRIHSLEPELFGEGITCYNDTIFQLTWENHVGFAYIERDTFATVKTVGYPYVGWGLTHDEASLILSDGSNKLYYLDPQTFEEVRRIEVKADGMPVSGLNELEYIQGKIYANILGAPYLVIIEPTTGEAVGWIDLGNLHTPRGVHNGIAFDPATSRLFVTGKRWEHLYEIRVAPIAYPPEIVASHPDPSVWIGVDSAVTLTLRCTDPDPEDTLEYTWSVNSAVDTSAHDSSYAFTSHVPTSDVIAAKVSDGLFCDSTSWTVTVGAAELYQNRPNPFSDATVIRFDLPKGGLVSLRVYDISGRLVAVLVDRTMPPGRHKVEWDGRGASGRKVAPGLYFVRLRTADFEATRTAVRLR